MSTLALSLNQAMAIEGALAVALVDFESGMALAKEGGHGLNLDVAAAGNSEVVKAKMKVMNALGLRTTLEDILITLGDQYHLIRPLSTAKNLFIYLVLSKAQGNLAMARFKLSEIEKSIKV
jgi:hypothetical protein